MTFMRINYKNYMIQVNKLCHIIILVYQMLDKAIVSNKTFLKDMRSYI